MTKTSPPFEESKQQQQQQQQPEIILQAFHPPHHSSEKVQPCYSIRKEVFIKEQRVPPEVETDGLDNVAIHILATHKESGTPVGAARLVFVENQQIGKIGRVCVLESYRKQGIGRKIVLFAVKQLQSDDLKWDCIKAKLGAQVHAISFYESMGFELIVDGEEYMDAGGVPHRDMEMKF